MRVRLKAAMLGAVAVAALMALPACSTMNSALGLGKMPPNEYEVAPRRALSMPPDYELRAPQPGTPARADIDARSVAASALSQAGTPAATTVPAAAPAEAAPAPATPASPAAPPAARPAAAPASAPSAEGEARTLPTRPSQGN